jgi:hypothetical protein
MGKKVIFFSIWVFFFFFFWGGLFYLRSYLSASV